MERNVEVERSKNYTLTLIPAYGRDYLTAKECLEAYREGKDFKVACVMSPWNGSATSVRDQKDFPGKSLKIRFNKLQDCILLDLKTDEVRDEEGELL